MKDKLFLFTCIILFSLSSCKKNIIEMDDDYEKVVKSLALYDSLPINKGDTILVDLKIKFDYYDYVSLPAFLEEIAKSDGKLFARVDYSNTLLNVFDSLYNTKSPRIAEGMFKVSNGGVLNVKKGMIQTADSITLKIDDVSKFTKTGNIMYVVPVLIESKEDNLKVKSKVVFIRYRVWQTFIINSNVENDVFPVVNTSTTFTLNTIRKRFSYPHEMAIEFELDNSPNVIENYNSTRGSNFVELPSELLTNNNNLVLRSNSLTPLTYPSFTINNTSLDKKRDYIKVLKIKSVNGEPIISNYRMYLLYYWNRIDPANPRIEGEKVDRAAWAITGSSFFIGSVPDNIIDGKNNTAWESSGTPAPAWFVVDMKKKITIKGFEIVPNYVNRRTNFLTMSVVGSDDGIKWDYLGRYAGTATAASSSASAPDYKNCRFLVPLDYRYYKFTAITTSDSNNGYMGLSEIYAIK